MKKLGYLALVFTITAIAACASEPDPSASGVFPAQGFAGRKLRVEVSGDVTTWTDGAMVSFGDGVTVDDVQVASPTDLFADITIDSGAALGMRDVTVTSDGTYTLKQAFSVTSPVEISWQGTLAQGSVAVFTVKNLDAENPFDTTAQIDPLTGAATYTNIAIQAPTGVQMSVQNVSDLTMMGTALIDIDAQPGAATISSGPTGSQTTFASDNLAIASRTAMALTSGTPVTGNIANPYDSQLYQFTTGSSSEVASIFAASTDQNASPGLAILPSSGHFADLLTFGTADNEFLDSGTSFYLVYWDNSGYSGYSYTVGATDHGIAANAADTEPNDTSAAAQSATSLPFELTNATLTDDNDQDWIAVTAAPGDVGKTLHAVTGGGDAFTDALLDICDSTSCAAGLSGAVAESSDGGYNNEDVTFTIPAAGTYYVVVSASPYGLVQGHNAYAAAVWIE